MTHTPAWLQIFFYADYFGLGVLAHMGLRRLQVRRDTRRMRMELERQGYEVLHIEPCAETTHFNVEAKERATHD